MMNTLNWRLEELNDSAQYGAIIICLSRPIVGLVSRQGSILLKYEDWPLVGICQPVRREVPRVEYIGPAAAEQYASTIIQSTDKFDVELIFDELDPLFISNAWTTGRRSVYGGFKRISERGGVFFNPARSNWNGCDDEYFQKLIEGIVIFSSLVVEESRPKKVEPPSWSRAYVTQREHGNIEELSELRKEEHCLKVRIVEKTTEIEADTWLRALYTSSGGEFVESLLKVLECLQFKTVHGPDSQTDIIAFDGETVLAIEAKGRDKGVKTSHICQARHWMDQVIFAQQAAPHMRDVVIQKYIPILSKLGIPTNDKGSDDFTPLPTKAAIIHNTFRRSPLADRYPENPSQPSFSKNARRAIDSFDAVAFTGLQALGMYLDLRDKGGSTADLQSLLTKTVGVLEGYEDWREFLINIKP